MPRLKVFSTTSGIHDHVVAAPSRPAALKAWGAKTDLFSMGVAKQVTDPKIVKQAMDRPGEVISFNRSGSAKEVAQPRRKPRKPARPPSKAKLSAAEKRLDDLEARQSREREAIERQLRSIEGKLSKLTERHDKACDAAKEKVRQARDHYEAALADWGG